MPHRWGGGGGFSFRIGRHVTNHDYGNPEHSAASSIPSCHQDIVRKKVIMSSGGVQDTSSPAARRPRLDGTLMLPPPSGASSLTLPSPTRAGAAFLQEPSSVLVFKESVDNPRTVRSEDLQRSAPAALSQKLPPGSLVVHASSFDQTFRLSSSSPSSSKFDRYPPLPARLCFSRPSGQARASPSSSRLRSSSSHSLDHGGGSDGRRSLRQCSIRRPMGAAWFLARSRLKRVSPWEASPTTGWLKPFRCRRIWWNLGAPGDESAAAAQKTVVVMYIRKNYTRTPQGVYPFVCLFDVSRSTHGSVSTGFIGNSNLGS